MKLVVPLASAAVLALAACTPHPVGPARTFGKYEGKATTTAEAALSSVQTVRLVIETATREHAFGPYLSVTVSEQEDAIGGVQSTFASIQPPDEKADGLLEELDGLLDSALEHVVDVRLAVRRGQLGDLADLDGPLDGDRAALEHFIEEHQ
jgi:hypothetical protein